MRKRDRRALCLLAAAAGMTGLFPVSGFAQPLPIPTPLLDVTANDYNPTSGLLTPTIGPSGLIITGASNPTLVANQTSNGAQAIGFNGSNYFQLNTSGGARDVLTSGTNITIIAYIEPSGTVPSSTAWAIVGGASGAIQYRLDGGNNEQSILRGGVAHFGDSNSGVSSSAFSSVGATLPTGTTGTANFFLNAATDGSENISSALVGGFDQIGGRDSGNGTTESFSGKIVELDVYNSVLTAAQVIQVQNQMATNYTSTTQLYYTGANNTFVTGSTGFSTITGAAATYADGINQVVFADTLPNSLTPVSNSNIIIPAGGVSPIGITLNNNVLSYSFTDASGTTGITGSGGITKNYNGTLTFNSSNSFTGPVVLSGGSTYLAGNGAIDSASTAVVGTGASLIVQSGITLGGTTNVNLAGGTLSLPSGSIFASTGGAAINSGGVLNLASGGTITSPGGVTVNNGGAFVVAAGVSTIGPSVPIVLNANSTTNALIFNQSGALTTNSYPQPITLSATSTIYVQQGNISLTGTVSGPGGLYVNNLGLLTLAGSNTYAGTTFVNSGALQITGNYSPSNTSNLSFGGGGSTNTLLINGGNVNFTGLGRVDMGNGVGTTSNLVVNSGTLNIAGAVTVSDNNFGALTVSGGAVNLTGVLALGYPTGTAAVNVLGGTVSTTSNLAGITVGNRGYTSQLNLDGGTLIASTVQGNNNLLGQLAFNGGTLQANASTTTLVSGIGSAVIFSGGGTINDSGYAITIPQSISSPLGTGLTAVTLSSPGTGFSYIPTIRVTGGTLSTGGLGATAVAIFNASTGQVTGVQITNPGNYASTTGVTFGFSGGGGVAPAYNFSSATNVAGPFNKIGSGTLTLTGNNTYSGATNVLQGTLQASSPGTSVTVPNGNFASPVVGTYTFGSGSGQPIGLNSSNASFTFTGNFTGITQGAGYTEDGTPPVGSQYAFVQDSGSISENITFPNTGTYALSFYSEERIGFNQNLNVSIGSTVLSPAGGFYPGVTWAQQTYLFTETAGTTVPLTFAGDNTVVGDQSALLNNLQINQIGVAGSNVSTGVPSTSQVNVASGATFDVNSMIITVGSLAGSGNVTLETGALSIGGDNSTNGIFSGVISGSGTLTKVGTGSQLLTGLNSYTGATKITQGTLALGAGTVLVSPSISVGNGGVLGAQPGAGNTAVYGGLVSVAPGGSISMVEGVLGNLSLTNTSAGALTLGSTGSSVPANLTFQIGNGSTGTDHITTASSVMALSPVYVTIVGLATDNTITPGSYTLITAPGGLGTSLFSLGGVNAIAVNGFGYGLSLASSTSTSEVVTVTSLGTALATAYWAGAIDGNWGTNNGGSTNWRTNANGSTDTNAIPSAFTNVYFTVASGGANLATSLSSNQSINSITFNGFAAGPVSISGYTLTIGASAIGGNAAGNGLNMASGSTAVTINSNVTLIASQTWTNNSPNPLTVTGSIGGLASLTQVGPGPVVLAGANTFNGGYNLTGGSLAINNNGALGTGQFTLGGTPTIDNTSGATVNLTANNTEAWNSDFTFTGTNNLNMGNGAVTISGPRTVTLTAGSLTVGGIGDGGQGYGFTTAGAGNLNISGTSSYTGFTAVHGSSSLSFVGAGGYSGGGTLFLTPGSATQTVALNINTTGVVSFGGAELQLGNAVGTSVVNLSSGTVNVATGILTSINGGTTIINVTGGTLNSDVGVGTGQGGQGGNFEFGNGGLAILNQSGGTINVTGGEPAGDVLLSTFATGATFNLTGGAFNAEGGTIAGYRYPAYILVSGTAHYTSPQIVLGAVSSASGYNGVGYLNISTGGIVTTSNLRESGNGGFINFNGGTLQAGSNTTTLLNGYPTGTVNALAGGAIIDTNGFNATVSSPIISPAGVTSGITKIGAGTLILSANNGYSGTTKIAAGTLQLPLLNNGAIANYSFETPSLAGTNGYSYAPANAGWTFSGGGAAYGAGISNGGGFQYNGTIPDGSQYGFLQRNGNFYQNVNFPTNGSYTLSFYTEQRANSNPVQLGQAIDVVLDNPQSGGQDFYGTSPGLVPAATWQLSTYTFTTTAGSHQLTFEGLDPYGDDSTAYVDDVTLSGGGLSATSNILPSASPVVIAANAVFDTNNDSQQIGSLTGPALSSVLLEAGTLTTGNDNTSTTFAGTITGLGGVTKVGTGTQTFSGANNYSGGTNVTSGTLVFAAPGALPIFTSLTVTGGTAMAGLHAAGLTGGAKNNLFVSSLSLSGTTGAWTGTVDLSNNDMDVQNGNLAVITNQVAQGYNQGNWNGTGGILSSAAASSSTHIMALGVISNSTDQAAGQNGGTQLYSTFDGQTAAITDVLVKYTYYGDANLDGHVDGSDYSLIDNAFAANLTYLMNNPGGTNLPYTGWYNGDFNYDGVIDGSDYALIDNSFNTQGANIASQVASPTVQIGASSGASAVPEPTSLALLGIGAAGLLGRRRRRSC